MKKINFLKTMCLSLMLILAFAFKASAQVTTIDFENPDNDSEWTLVNSSSNVNKWYIGSATTGSNTFSDRKLFISDNGTRNQYATGSSVTVHAWRNVTFGEGGGSISFDYRVQGEGTGDLKYDYLNVYLLSSTATLTAGTLPTSNIIQSVLELRLKGASVWNTHTFDNIPSGTYKLVFSWKNDSSSGSQPPAAVDNIVITNNNFPTNLTVTPAVNEGAITADVTWTEHSTSTEWELKYKRASHSDWYTIRVSNEPQITLTNLQGNERYNVQVRTILEDNQLSMLAEAIFTTPCILPGESEDLTYYTLESSTAATSNSYLPFYGLYGFSYTQQIYDRALVGEAGTITAISYYANSIPNNAGNIQIWMGITSKSTFSGQTDYISPTELVKVFDGGTESWPTISEGWNRILLSTPFEYDGSSNLVIAFYEGRSGYNSSSFQAQSTVGIKAIYHSDDTRNKVSHTSPAEYAGAASSKGTQSYINYVKFEKTISECHDSEQCPTPSELAGSIVEGDGRAINLSWIPGTEESAWTICYKPVDSTTWTTIMVTENSYTLSNLQNETTYEIKVKVVCGEFMESDYTNTIEFYAITCRQPDNITSENTGTQTEISWSIADPTITDFAAEYKKSSETDWTSLGTIDTLYYLLSDLEPNTLYNFRVKSICSSEDESLWTNYNFTSITCAATPSNIQVSELTENGGSVTVTWNPQGDEIQWIVEYKLNEHEEWYSITVNNNPTLEIAPIQAGSQYNLRIKAVCAENYESAYITTTFSTDCISVGESYEAIFNTPSTSTPQGARTLPLHPYYGYSYSQQIYDQELIGESGTITNISFYSAKALNYVGNIKIWMANSSKSTFTGGRDFIDPSTLTLVYEGSPTWSVVAGENEITLTTPFEYDNTNNLVIAFYEGKSGDDGNADAFQVVARTGNKSIYQYDDTQSYINFNSPATSNTSNSYTTPNVNYISVKKTVVNCLDEELCPTPENFSILPGGNMAIFSWDVEEDATYELKYKEVDSTEWQVVTLTESPFELYTMISGRTYDIQFRRVCGAYNNSNVIEESFFFATCYPPINLASYNTGNSTTIYWDRSIYGESDNWTSEYKKASEGDDAWIVAALNSPDTVVTISNLEGNTLYNFRVMTTCVNTEESIYATYNFTSITCAATPSDIQVSELTENGGSVTVTWEPQGDEIQWIVEYKLADHEDWYSIQVIDTPKITLTPIQSYSIYQIRVKAVCAANYESAYAIGSLITNCFDGTIENDTIYSPETGSSTASTVLPLAPYYRYAYSQQIHDNTSIGEAGYISAISFYTTTALPNGVGNNKIWMTNTDKSTFSSNTNYVAPADLTLVYENAANWNVVPGWNKIVLDEPFYYDGTNLVIAFYEGRYEYDGSSSAASAFHVKSTTGTKSIYHYNDTQSNVSYTNPAGNSGTKGSLSSINYLKFDIQTVECFDTELCPTPEITGYEMVDDASTKITWTSAETANWDFYYREKGETEWNRVSVTENSYILTGLELNTYYEVRVKSICGEFNESDYSDIAEIFHARCFMPENIAYENEGVITTITWDPTESGGGERWIAQYKRTIDDENGWFSITTSTPELTLFNLLPATEYNFRVKSVCDITYESLWAEMNFSTRSCDIIPTSLTTTDITTESALLSWNASGGDRWIIEYYENGLDSRNTIEVTENSYLLTGLTTSTNYRWRVRTVCEDISYGNYSAIASFTTSALPCEVLRTLPFFEGFEISTFPPACWSHAALGASINWSRTTSSSSIHTGSGAATCSYNRASSINTWLVSPLIEIPENSTIKISFWHKSASPEDYVKYALLVAENNTTPGSSDFTEIWTPTSVSETWQQVVFETAAYAGKNISLALQSTGTDGSLWYVDDISVEVVGAAVDPCETPKNVDYSEDFTSVSTSCWTLEGDWAASNGELRIAETGATSTVTSPAISIPAGKYEVAYGYKGNNLKVMMGDAPDQITTVIANHTAAQTEMTRVVNYITITDDTTYYFAVEADPQTAIAFDNFSIKRIYEVEVSYLPSECGTVTPTGNNYVYANEFLSVNIIPELGSALSYIENQTGEIVQDASEHNVFVYHHRATADEQLFIAFNPIMNTTISYNDEENTATITPTGNHNVLYGDTQIYTIVTTPGYVPVQFLVTDNQGVTVDRYDELVRTANHEWEFTFENIVNNHTIEVVVEKAIITITTELAGEGTITPGETFRFDPDYTYHYEIVAENGYRIVKIERNGVPTELPDLETYNDSIEKPIVIDHTIKAFTTNLVAYYNVYGGDCYVNEILRSSADNTFIKYISPEGYRTTFTPVDGYRIARVVINGVEMGTIDQFYFYAITANQYVDIYVEKENYTISTVAYGNGTISEGTTFEFDPDFAYDFEVTPDEGYHINKITINGVAVDDITDAETTYYSTIESPILMNYTIEAYFTPNTYTIDAMAGDGGAITPNGTIAYHWNDSPVYVITANAGHYISALTVDGETVEDVDEVATSWRYTFNNISENHTIAVEFEKFTYTINAAVNETDGGSITPVGDSIVTYGEQVTYTIAANHGWDFVALEIDGINVAVSNTFAFVNVRSNHTIKAIFEKHVYTVTASAGDGGTITPNGVNEHLFQTSPQYTVNAATGYTINTITIDGIAQTIAPNTTTWDSTFTNIDANHIISATFAINTYTITATDPDNASITPADITTVNHGTDSEYTITPAEGYNITKVIVDEAEVAFTANTYGIATYIFRNITENHTITAETAIKSYTITPSANAGGTISPATVQTVNHGRNTVFTFTPNANYEVSGVLIDGIPTTVSNNRYEFTNITANHTIHVEFRMLTCESPSFLYATDIDTASATLVWENTGALRYDLQWKAVTEDNYRTVSNLTAATYNLTNLTPSTRYYFRVKAICNATGLETEYTPAASFRTLSVIPTIGPGSGVDDVTKRDVKVYSHLNNVYIVNEIGLVINSVEIYDIYGRKVYNGKSNSTKEEISLDVADGTYIVKLMTADGMKAYKVNILK